MFRIYWSGAQNNVYLTNVIGYIYTYGLFILVKNGVHVFKVQAFNIDNYPLTMTSHVAKTDLTILKSI